MSSAELIHIKIEGDDIVKNKLLILIYSIIISWGILAHLNLMNLFNISLFTLIFDGLYTISCLSVIIIFSITSNIIFSISVYKSIYISILVWFIFIGLISFCTYIYYMFFGIVLAMLLVMFSNKLNIKKLIYNNI